MIPIARAAAFTKCGPGNEPSGSKELRRAKPLMEYQLVESGRETRKESSLADEAQPELLQHVLEPWFSGSTEAPRIRSKVSARGRSARSRRFGREHSDPFLRLTGVSQVRQFHVAPYALSPLS